MKIVKAIGASIGIVLCFFYLGCGGMQIAQAGVPSISQVLPTTLLAGSNGATVRVVGSNFTDGAVVLWNGSPLNTTVVDDGTLTSPVQQASLTVPGVAQLAVKNVLTGKVSPAVKVNISSSSSSNTSSALSITTTSLPPGTQNSSYSVTLSGAGGHAPYTWSANHGSLPPGLSLSPSGTISGTPTATGNYGFRVTLKDSAHPAQSASSQLSIQIASPAEPVSTLATSNTTLPSGTVSTSYSYALQATSGTAPYTWSITSGNLPAGTTLSSNGVVSGTPTVSGTFTFSVSVQDSSNPTQRATATETLTVSATALKITTASLPNGTNGQSYSQTLQAGGGTTPYAWSVASGSLPAGLSLSSSGIISGTPTGSGVSSFTVKAIDSSNPVQSTTAPVSITVGATALSVTMPGLPAVTVGTSYSQTVKATGGTTPYTWSIASGSLPPGLSLSATTGAISGTVTSSSLTTNYTYNFAVKVIDASNPTQSATASGAITLASNPLSITSSALPSGTVSAGYTGSLQATGGQTAYTWSISSGSLPAGLTLAATTGTISGTPTTAGTSNFTASVTDSGNPAQTQSVATSITINAALTSSTAGATWYVNANGGTRYSTNVPTGLCDGKSSAAPVGSTPNQHCAFNDIRYLWQDGSYTTGSSFPGWGWVVQAGDTVILDCSGMPNGSCRVGWNNPNSSWDNTVNQYRGIQGDPYGSGAPAFPSGTATAHTRILGVNYAACTASGAKAKINGGYGLYRVFSFDGVSNVDVSCLDITDFSACGRSSQTRGCSTSVPIDDFINTGIEWNNQATNDTMTDVSIHGAAENGMHGPTGDGVVLTRVSVIGNASSGWNMDAGDGTTGTGHLTLSYFTTMWNGCAEEYPIQDSLPYQDCTDDNTGGYGDGIGTATVGSNPAWIVNVDHSTAAYNTQDGFDLLHLEGNGSTLTITNSLSYGNMGQQLKVGSASTAINNVIVGNCNALRQNIPGTPSGYNSRLSDFCRAADTAVYMAVQDGSTTKFQYNTIYSANAVALEIGVNNSCAAPGGTCLLQYENNVMYGFLNTAVNGYPSGGSGNYPAPLYMDGNNPFQNTGSVNRNNATHNQKPNYACPNSSYGEVNAVCGDPILNDETWHLYGYGDMSPATTSSPVIGAGVGISGIGIDYTGRIRNTPPSIGAYEAPN